LHFCSFVHNILICVAQKTTVEVLDRPHICNNIYINYRSVHAYFKVIPRLWSCDAKRSPNSSPVRGITKSSLVAERRVYCHRRLCDSTSFAHETYELKTHFISSEMRYNFFFRRLVFPPSVCAHAAAIKFCKPRSSVFACTIGSRTAKNSAQDALEVGILRSKIKTPPPHTLPPRRLRRLDAHACGARSLGFPRFSNSGYGTGSYSNVTLTDAICAHSKATS